ncbi:disA bacterial checkpoint controller nucleotide-binding domain-containing protein [Ditylenchus destructor]|uniref:DisA bacterial checkpoint controller nucleotide-binding domain-containing protein n=1 Tax=Ditylenchus destructor TaxID=166010 RepID=A0AAD4MNA0_9BILA|nr:disA bacterial checkpoint controller nucleotide-binding domain-containing protein [Ditylenchus destructor]
MDTMQKWQKVPLELVHLGARHGSAYSVSQCCFRALVVVVSEEKGRVSVFKGGKFELGVTKKKIAQELLTMYQKNNGVSLDQGLLFDQKHFKAKVTTQMFDPNDDVHVDWYYRHITKCRVQLYKGNEYKTNSSIKPGDMALKCKQKEVRKANETRLLKLKYIEIVKLKIILYNGMPFGGIRYNLCLATRTIDLDLLNAFVEREHFQNGLLAYILQEQLFKEFYPIFNKITFRFEPHLRERIEKFVSDLKIEVDSSDKQFLYYTIHISGANDAGSSSTSSALSLHSSGSAYINPVVPVPSTPLNANLVEENCESLVIRVRKNDIFLHLDVAITRHINWIRPNSIVAKQLKVGDKIVGIKGVEFSMELEHLERMTEKEREENSGQPALPVNTTACPGAELSQPT